MENTGLSASDIALLGKDGMGSNAFIWIFALLILANGGLGGWGNNNFGQYATAASQSEILFGQQFQGLNQAINKVGDGLSSLGYSQLQQMDNNTASINGNIVNEGRSLQAQLSNCCCENQRNTDALRYDMATMFATSNANTTAQTQKILDAISQNKIDTLQSQLNTVTMQQAIQNAMCGIPKINPYMYGISCNSGCNCSSI